MGKNSKIDWTDHTWNPWHGCRKVSAGCMNCYMYRDKKRFGSDPEKVVRATFPTFTLPCRIKEPSRIFVCSWSDFFIEDADPWRDGAWDIMRVTPHLTYLILTKRPENIIDRLPSGWPWPNVWLGVTAENQEMADKRIPILLQIPAAVRFVSIEPMLGPVDLDDLTLRFADRSEHHFNALSCDVDVDDDGDFHGKCLDWVICGGESGPNPRPMEEEWAYDLLNQCRYAGVKFFMKQMSGRQPIPDYLNVREFPGK